jgi:hypothetical protein
MSDGHDFITVNKPNDELYKEICNKIECKNLATDEVKLSAGSFGIITLRVCKKCKSIFKENQNDKQ